MPPSGEKSPHIAVIAIHGVADQLPRDTARAAVDMLLRAEQLAAEIPKRQPQPAGQRGEEERQKAGRYQGFEQHELRIAVTEVHSGAPTPLKKRALFDDSGPSFSERLRSLFSFEVQSHTIKSRRLRSSPENEPEPEAGGRAAVAKDVSKADAISLEYMDEQLRDCVVPAGEKTYDTIRFESIRTGSRAHVHVFEMYWADLSRPVGNLIRWLMEFYQLLFQLCMVGRKSLDFACAEYEPDARRERRGWAWLWPAFGWSQLIAEQALALAVPILGLYLLALCVAVSPLFLDQKYLDPVIVGSATVITAVAIGLGIYFVRRRISATGRAWPALLLLPGSAAVLVLLYYLGETAPAHAVWLAWGASVIGILFLMSYHQETRKGAFPMAFGIGVLVTLWLGWSLVHAPSTPEGIFGAIVYTADLTAWLLLMAWIVVIVAAAAATLVGFFIGKAVPRNQERLPQARDRVRRAAWTTNLTLVLPALTVLILNLSLWQALVVAFVPEASVAQETAGIKGRRVWNARVETFVHDFKPELPLEKPLANGKGTGEAWDVTRAMVKRASTGLYFAVAGSFALAAILLIWSIVPAVIVEIRPGGGKDPLQKRKDKSSWLGESLSAGFRAMRGSGEIVRVAFLLFLPAVVLVAKYNPDFSKKFGEWNQLFLFLGAAIVLGIVASQGPFKALALGLRAGLDVALDVINWLRLHPREANPRARICARYASLLREIQRWRDPTDETQGYDGIVILAHSQGTVITADLLRYLRANGQSPSLPIYLFTMGCPLRQLYSLRFPHLYGWARHDGETWAGSEPLPSEVNVKLWVNAYRSGDYVGRYLWHPDRGQDMWSTSIVHVNAEDGDPARGKREFCIGAGAHTHYWDETAPEIAVELDRLVGLAASEALAGP